jgi:hypothetical protein
MPLRYVIDVTTGSLIQCKNSAAHILAAEGKSRRKSFIELPAVIEAEA